MSRPRQRALVVATAVVAAGAAFVLALGPQQTLAAWTVTKSLGITATAATATAVPTVACGSSGGALATAIPITWTAPSGATPSRYRLVWAGAAGSGQAYFTTTSGSIPGGVLSVLGQSVVTVYPEYGDWTTSPVSLESRTVTTISALGIVVAWSCA